LLFFTVPRHVPRDSLKALHLTLNNITRADISTSFVPRLFDMHDVATYMVAHRARSGEQ